MFNDAAIDAAVEAMAKVMAQPYTCPSCGGLQSWAGRRKIRAVDCEFDCFDQCAVCGNWEKGPAFGKNFR